MARWGHRWVCQKWQILLQKEAQNRQSDDTQNLRNPARLSGIFLCIFHKDIFTKNQMRFLYKLPIDNQTKMWYDGGPLTSEPARISDRVYICKIFVQSSPFPYGLSFSRNLTSSSNFIFKPPLTHISNFIWHTAHFNFL